MKPYIRFRFRNGGLIETTFMRLEHLMGKGHERAELQEVDPSVEKKLATLMMLQGGEDYSVTIPGLGGVWWNTEDQVCYYVEVEWDGDNWVAAGTAVPEAE